MPNERINTQNPITFSGNIFLFHAFDIGDDIDLEKVEKSQTLIKRPQNLPRYFKDYHIPLSVELPHPHETSTCMSCKIHSFGVVSLVYKIPFEQTLEDLRENIATIDNKYLEQSVSDAGAIFKKIKPFIAQPKFFHLRKSYLVIQVNPEISAGEIKRQYGHIIASLVRFETESLSEYQRNDILESAIGYYRGDLIIIDSEAAFVADKEYDDILDLFEFANIQQLELQYFDRLLNQQLHLIYERKIRPITWKAYFPFIGVKTDATVELGRLRADISVITERLDSSIKLMGDPYYSEIYNTLSEHMELDNWKESISKKLDIITDVRLVYQNLTDTIRENVLEVLIIILIFIELVVGILSYLKN